MRWIIAERRTAPARRGPSARPSRVVEPMASPYVADAMAAALAMLSADADVVRDSADVGPDVRRRAMVRTEPATIRAMQDRFGNALRVEPEILHVPAPVPPIDFLGLAPATSTARPQAGARGLSVTVTGGGGPLRDAALVLYLRGGGAENAVPGTTDAAGRARFDFPALYSPAALAVVPVAGFWSLSVRGPRDGQTIDCPALPADGPVGWWHEVVGAARAGKVRGRSIKVGIIDTGVGPHPCLDHVTDIGSFVGGTFDAAGGADSGSHGTHVCGIVGARPVEAGQYAGVAPGVKLYSARVFPPDGGANQMDIADALDALSAVHEADLVNMSLGAPVGSRIERDAILDALARGTLCVCAAGNEAGPVSYPAAFPETVAVSALGAEGRSPPGTQSASRLPASPERFGDEGLYLADFSCSGPEIACAAPGVGIVSTVPAHGGRAMPYAAFDGTSMASPLACGTLAALLAASPGYRAMPRDADRAATARRLLLARCRNIGLDPVFQGRGVPTLGDAYAVA